MIAWPRRMPLVGLGWGLLLPVLLLLAIGLMTIHATEEPRPSGAGRSEDGWFGLGATTTKQLVYAGAGFGLLLAVTLPSYQRLGRYAIALYVLVLALLALLVGNIYVDLPMVPVVRGTRRWIGYGVFQIQPSEFMKLALVVALARYLRFRSSYRRWLGLLPPLAMTLVPMVLILKQPDLGTLLMLLPTLFAMLFVAGARLRHLLLIILLGGATLPLFYFFGMKEYQRQRVDVVFRQGTADESWHANQGYQLRQSKTALGIGRLTGQGYREGVFIRYGLLPEEHNDFIFAIIGNQWGLLGCALVILCFGVIAVVGLEIATVTNDPFGRLLAVGVVVMIVVQALLNIGMTLGLAPITGMPLPFVSAGGSSLWANFLALGLLLNVAQRRPMLIANPPFEHAD